MSVVRRQEAVNNKLKIKLNIFFFKEIRKILKSNLLQGRTNDAG